MDVKNLHAKLENLKLLKENTENNFLDMSLDNDFLGMTPKVQSVKAKTNNETASNLKASVQQKK